MIRIVSQHTWQLALLEIRKQKSLVASLERTADQYRAERDEALGRVERLEQEVVELQESLESYAEDYELARDS